jgi:hypothetical protein
MSRQRFFSFASFAVAFENFAGQKFVKARTAKKARLEIEGVSTSLTQPQRPEKSH